MLGQLMRKMDFLLRSPKLMARSWSLWPPFLAAGIKIDQISSDFRLVQVSMPLTLRNANYVGTHFGGSLYAMTDPFFMAMFMHNLGREYIVWDHSARIRFKKPGRGKVRVVFKLSEEDIQAVLSNIESNPERKILWERQVEILDEQDEVVATVLKVVYIRQKE